MSNSRPRADSVSGKKFLTSEQVEIMKRLIGDRKQNLAMACAKISVSNKNKHCGVLCLIKDLNEKAYYLYLYCLNKLVDIWNIKIRDSFKFSQQNGLLYKLKTDRGTFKIEFLDEEDSKWFFNVMKLAIKRAELIKESDVIEYDDIGNPTNFKHVAHSKTEDEFFEIEETLPSFPPELRPKKEDLAVENKVPTRSSIAEKFAQHWKRKSIEVPKRTSQIDTRKRINKAEIGAPQDFQHLEHLGIQDVVEQIESERVTTVTTKTIEIKTTVEEENEDEEQHQVDSNSEEEEKVEQEAPAAPKNMFLQELSAKLNKSSSTESNLSNTDDDNNVHDNNCAAPINNMQQINNDDIVNV